MSKQNLTILIVVIVSLVVGGLFGFYFYLNHKAGGALSLNSQTNNGYFNLGSSTPNQSQGASDTSTSTPTVTSTIPRPIPILRHLTAAPVAGSGFINKTVISTTSTDFLGISTTTPKTKTVTYEVFRWVDRATGNIFETSSTTLETTRITNTTIPKVYEAYFVDPKGQSVLLRGLENDSDVIETQYGILQPGSASYSDLMIKTNNLLNNITQLAVSPSGDKIFSILPTAIRGAMSKPDGSSQVNFFNSPFNEWLVSWPIQSTIVLNTKPSGIADGYAYTLDTKTGTFAKLIGNEKGLTTLMSPDGSNVLVGTSPLGTTELSVLDRKTGSLRDLYVRTFPDKCVWSRKNPTTTYCAVPNDIQYDVYPDAWYMGRVSFSDSIWKIDTKTGQSILLAQPPYLVGQSIDVMNPQLDANEDFLMFQDKNDLSLWSYQLSTTTNTVTSTN